MYNVMFNVHIYCEMITPVKLRNISIISQLPFCVCVCDENTYILLSWQISSIQ